MAVTSARYAPRRTGARPAVRRGTAIVAETLLIDWLVDFDVVAAP